MLTRTRCSSYENRLSMVSLESYISQYFFPQNCQIQVFYFYWGLVKLIAFYVVLILFGFNRSMVNKVRDPPVSWDIQIAVQK